MLFSTIRRPVRVGAAMLLLFSLTSAAPVSAGTLAPVDGRIFAVADKLKLKLTGFQNAKGNATAAVSFGPNGALESDEVQILIDDGETVFGAAGTYSVDAKGKPVITLDPGELATLLENLFDELGDVEEGVTLEVIVKDIEIKAKAKEKDPDPDKFKLRMAIKFNVKATGEGGTEKIKARLLFEGVGAEAAPEA